MIPALIVGWSLILFGARAALDDAGDAHPFAILVHVVAFDLAHDLIVVPVVLLVGWFIGRVLPSVARGPVRAAAAASALLLTFSYPLVRRWGRRPGNSSTLPLEYGRNVAILLAVIWVLAAATIVRRSIRARSTPAPNPEAFIPEAIVAEDAS